MAPTVHTRRGLAGAGGTGLACSSFQIRQRPLDTKSLPVREWSTEAKRGRADAQLPDGILHGHALAVQNLYFPKFADNFLRLKRFLVISDRPHSKTLEWTHPMVADQSAKIGHCSATPKGWSYF